MVLKKAFEYDKADKYVLSNLGVVYFNLKNYEYEEASSYFHLSIQNDTFFPNGIKNLEVTCQLQNKVTDSIMYYEKAIVCNPLNHKLYPSLINLYIKTGNKGKANEYQTKLNSLNH